MIEHIGILTLAPGAPADTRGRIRDGLASLVGVVPGLVDVLTRGDLGLKEGNGSLVFRMHFETSDDWRGYFGHPAHVAVSHELIQPFTVGYLFLQVEPEGDYA